MRGNRRRALEDSPAALPSPPPSPPGGGKGPLCQNRRDDRGEEGRGTGGAGGDELRHPDRALLRGAGAGGVSVHEGHLGGGVPEPVLDDAAVRRVRLGARVEPPVPVPPRTGADGPFGGLRPADADGLRLRRSARPRGSREGGRVDRHDRRHAPVDRRDPARRGFHFHDDQRHGPDSSRLPAPRGERTGNCVERAVGDNPERHPEGIRRPRNLHLSAPAFAEADDRHLRVLRPRGPALEHDLDLRVPHPRGRLDGRAGDRLHAVERDRLRRGGPRARPRDRRLRAAAVLLLQRPLELLRGGRQVPRGPRPLGRRSPGTASARKIPARGACASTRRRRARR